MVTQATMRTTKMTWKEATYCYIHNVKRETDGFHKTASALGAFFRTIAARFGIGGSLALLCDNLLDVVPGINIITIGDDVIMYPLAAFTVYSLFRISAIRRDFNRHR